MTHAPHTAGRGRMLALPVLAAGVALLAGGGGASTGADASSVAKPATASGKPARAMTVQQLAAALGCQANLAGRAADFRQATCMAAEARLVLLDFDTVKAQRDWLEAAEMYGGVYLVGDRWALSGKSKEELETLAATLGGTVEEGSSHDSGNTDHNGHHPGGS